MDPLETLHGRILIAGYYGFGNAGDELILRTMVSTLKSNSKVSSIRAFSSNPERTMLEHGVDAVSRWSPWKIFKAVLSCDRLVLGGGGLLQDKTGNLSLWYYLLILWTGILLGKRTMVYAVGVGPIRSRINVKLTGFTLNFIHEISVRDRQSFSELKNYGIRKEIFLSRDPVLNLKVPERSMGMRGCYKIGVIARELKGIDETLFLSRLSHALIAFAGRIGGDISVIPFHPSLDLSISKVLHEKIKTSRMATWDSLDGLLELFSGLDMAVCMRFHGLILSALYKIPILALESDPKMRYFMENEDTDASLVSFVSMDRLGVENFEDLLRELLERTRHGIHLLS